MATLGQPVEAVTGGAVGRMLADHRAAWARAVLGDGAVDLDAREDPAAALAEAASGAAFWVDAYDPAALPALADAARAGSRLVVAVPATGELAGDLTRALDGAQVPQAVAATSVIGALPEAPAEVADGDVASRAVWTLVCANVSEADLRAAGARVGVAAGSGFAAHVARLESALEALQEANVRLAREQLGHHDAAAGTIVGRLEQRARAAEAAAEEWQTRFEAEQQLAIKHHEWFQNARARLNTPHHRAAERLYRLLACIPGMRRLLARLG